MNVEVRVTAPLKALAARIRAAALAGRGGRDDAAVAVRLPSTSNIREPATIAALGRFEEPGQGRT